MHTRTRVTIDPRLRSRRATSTARATSIYLKNEYIYIHITATVRRDSPIVIAGFKPEARTVQQFAQSAGVTKNNHVAAPFAKPTQTPNHATGKKKQ